MVIMNFTVGLGFRDLEIGSCVDEEIAVAVVVVVVVGEE